MDRPGVEPIGFHVIFRLADDRPIATTAAERRVLARVVLDQGEHRGLLAFGAADDHLHAELATTRSMAGAFARYVECALRWKLRIGTPFERARIRPLENQRHAYRTLHYAHRQDSGHGLGVDPAREATSLPELLGLRVSGTSLSARVHALLPRVRREDLLTSFPTGAFDDTVPIDLEVLADAAAAAFALPDLRGRCSQTSRARRAATHVAGLGVPGRLVSDYLGVGVRAVQAMRAEPGEEKVIRAVANQARLRATLRASAGARP